ncbi:hypothetical protein JHK82_055620 [Glycine max]|nr:uncharacterized protein LOC102664832 [Glycine max]XP_028221322.1 uncharacterized protein LOC114402833 isoform X1 [Glycine soja]XP_028221323.1 uncharacterized protein LOC114402833 isoform X1 [Glycine soja]KAG4906964.1 hypothetical protein JHK86_055448 [Glycine max]KAG4909595.1 hypothetical protein JHK87_055711 [Glycine soja]KAG4918177.1 hypothetical protein JHK85_056458 [Glycine max]KAG5074254.1 hypothetical protein JHK84_055485 [Glycine max]KAG5076925.1 hypothetical protein JHK82_055620 [|eukprot:XP_006605700.1 uncharacterized protein LOC102664832 [Glycine max]
MASGSSSALNSNSKVAEGIWKAAASLRCRKLLWRACREGLPVRSLLLQKGIIKDDDTCPCCGTCKETTTHALLLCEGVKPFWLGSPLGLRVDSWHNVANITMLQWVDQCVDVLDKRGMGMLCAMVWGLWNKRNAWVLKKKKLDFAQVMAKALSVFVTDEWVPPLDSKIKANFAASVIEDVGTGLGVVFRNSKGEPMASGTYFMADECYDSEIADTLCYKWAIEKAEELWFPEVIFETDCQQLYTQWNILTQGNNNTSDYTSYLNEILDECINMMQGTESSLTLVVHNANKVAQCLAAVAYDYGERIWVEDVPNEASECLQSDAAEIANVSSNQ